MVLILNSFRILPSPLSLDYDIDDADDADEFYSVCNISKNVKAGRKLKGNQVHPAAVLSHVCAENLILI